MKTAHLLYLLSCISIQVSAIEYPYSTKEPQKTGWPLSSEERVYVTERAEHERRPGKEENRHLPKLWPVVPTAGHFGGDAWLRLHAERIESLRSSKDPVDVLLVGDSLTIQWGASWQKLFPTHTAANIGIGGDKTQNVLWRLEHGGADGIRPAQIVLMIGNNNMFFVPETGVEAAARGIWMCVDKLREMFPSAHLILAKILPAHAPGNRFYEDIKRTNEAVDRLREARHSGVQMLDLTADFTSADGSLQESLYLPDKIHLTAAGYEVYAKKLGPLLRPH